MKTPSKRSSPYFFLIIIARIMNTQIVTLGEILLRIYKTGYQRLFQNHRMNGNYGGSEANAAISLAYVGDKVE